MTQQFKGPVMTRRGQVEWFGSGDCEPVLAAIPHRDRVTQITTLSDKIERRFGMRPSGAWLTERVSDLPRAYPRPQ